MDPLMGHPEYIKEKHTNSMTIIIAQPKPID